MPNDDDDLGIDYSDYETQVYAGSDAPNTESGDVLSTGSTNSEAAAESLDLDLSAGSGEAGDSSGIALTEAGDLMMPAYDLGYDNHSYEAANNPNDTDFDGIPSSIDSDEFQSLEGQVYGYYADQNENAQLEYNASELIEESGHLAVFYLEDGLEGLGEQALGQAVEHLGADAMTGGAAELAFYLDGIADAVQYTAEANERSNERADSNDCYNLQSEALDRLGSGEDASLVIDSLETHDCIDVLEQDSIDFDALQECTWNESSLEDVTSCYESEVAPTSVDVVTPNGDEAAVGLSSFSEEGSPHAMTEPYEFDVETDMGYCGNTASSDFAAASDAGGDSFDSGDDGEY